MYLLAQTTGSVPVDWGDLLFKQGPLAVIFVLFIGFIIWYGRRMAEGHIELIGTLKENSVKTTVNLEKLTETQVELVKQAKDFKCRAPVTHAHHLRRPRFASHRTVFRVAHCRHAGASERQGWQRVFDCRGDGPRNDLACCRGSHGPDRQCGRAGHAVAISRELRDRRSVCEGDGGVMHSRPTIDRWPTALPVELIGPALAMVEVAFNHGNREEAIAAVHRVFDEAGRAEQLCLDSPLGDLGLPVRICNAYEMAGMRTIRNLTEWTKTRLETLANIGNACVRVTETALEKHGWSLSSDLSDGTTGLRPGSHRQWLDRMRSKAG